MPAIAPSLALCQRGRGAICDCWRRVLRRRTLLTRGQQTSLPAPERNPMTVATALELSLLHENLEHVVGTLNCQC